VNEAHFSSAFFLVSSLIQSSFSMRAFSDSRRFCTSVSMRAFDSAGKATLTYSWPMVSPAWPSISSSTRLPRSFNSFWPLSFWL
jgi:hypothetical protein